MLKESPEWQMGRRGEILQLATLTRFGFSVIDVGGSSNEKAPFLHRYEFNFIAPDAMAFKSGPLWMEFKTKGHHQVWKGGGRADPVKTPPQTEQGIDRVNYEAYLKTQEDTQVPVVLMVLSIKEGELLGNTLNGLGEPRYSPNPAWDLVNWPIWKFRRLCQFDCEQLWRYFYTKNGALRGAPHDVPSAAQLRQWLDRLKPAQGELDLIMMDIVAQTERDWHE